MTIMDATKFLLSDTRPDADVKPIRQAVMLISHDDQSEQYDHDSNVDQHDVAKQRAFEKDVKYLSDRSLRYIIFHSKEPTWVKKMAMEALCEREKAKVWQWWLLVYVKRHVYWLCLV